MTAEYTPRKRRKPRRNYCAPAPQYSSRMYVRIEPSKIALFRFLMEAHDNLGIFTVTDKFKGILLLRYSPQQQHEFDEFLDCIRHEMEMDVVMDAHETL